MSHTPLLSVVIPTYNHEAYIRRTLDSVLEQGIDDMEILVYDDCSTDKTAEIVSSYLHDNRISLVQQPRNLGPKPNSQQALDAARGRYLVWLSGDDWFYAGHFISGLKVLEANSEIALVYSPCYWVDTNDRVTRVLQHPGHPPHNYTGGRNEVAELLVSDSYITPSSAIFRTQWFHEAGAFDTDIRGGDWDLFIRIAREHPDFAFLSEPSTAYRIHDGQCSHAFYRSTDPLHTHLRVLEKTLDSPQAECLTNHLQPIFEHLERRIAEYKKKDLEPFNDRIAEVCDKFSRLAGKRTYLDEPLVSVVVPTYNRPELLQDALRSLVTQDYGNWEAVVVNDAGVDVSSLVASIDPQRRIRYLQHTMNCGVSAARNTAICFSRGEVICYLDDDDVFRPQHLKTVVNALQNNQAAFVYTEAEYIHEQVKNGVRRERSRTQPYSGIEYSKTRLHISNYIPVDTWAHKRDLLNAAGLFDPELNSFEDWDLLLRFSRLVDFVHIHELTTEVHMRHSDKNEHATQRERKDFLPLYRKLYERYPVETSDAEAARECQLNSLEQGQKTYGDEGECAEDLNNPAHISDKLQVQFLRKQFLQRVEESSYVLPSIHLIMVADESNIVKIADTIESLDQQIYTGWGLSVISAVPAPHQDFDALPMLEWIQSEDVGQSFIDTAHQSECDWVALVMPGDTLESEALSVFVDYINQNPGWKFIYSDEDCVDVSGNQVNHKFKPDINPDYLYSSPYTGNLSLIHQDVLGQLSTDIGIPAASFFDLALKVLDQQGESAIGHIPTLLYHQLQDNERQEARETWVRPVLEACVTRNNIDAQVLDAAVAGACMIDYRCSGTPGVCVAIYAGDDLAKVERTLASLVNKTIYANWTVRIGLDRALAPQLEKYQIDQLTVDSLDQNTGRCTYLDNLVQKVDAEYMVFMDPGVIVLQDNWLERLLAQGQRPETGAVGVRLLSPQSRIAHAGILTGIGSFGVGGCIGEGDTLEQEGYMQRSQVVQNLSAVSSACMLVKRSLYQSLKGFDAKIAVSLYSDVDFCLRVKEAGKRIVWTPFVTMLVPDERLDTYTGDDGISRVEKDARRITSTWLKTLARDPAYNRNLTLARADYSAETDLKPVWDPNTRDLPRITGCGYGSYVVWAYRVAQPLNALSAAGKAHYSPVPFKGKTLDRMPGVVEMERLQPDVMLLQNSLHDTCLDSLRQYREVKNMFMVFGQDDLMFAIPPKNPRFKTGYKDIKKRLRTCLSLVDRLIVTNETLADELSGFITDIRIVPNYLDAGMWGKPESRRGCGAKPRVGWAGAMQHYGDLEIIADAVRETADEVDWIFMGMCPDFLRPYVKEVHEYVAFNAYPAALAKLNLDLAVAPLERNRFNRCKSNLRILEYGAMGWPVIATDIEPYKGAPVHRVSNKTRAWVSAIREHIHDLDANWKAGDTLQGWVRENHLLQQHLDDWLDALNPSGRSYRQSLAPGKASGL